MIFRKTQNHFKKCIIPKWDNSEIQKIPCQKHVPDLISTKKHELFRVFIRVNRARFVVQKKRGYL